MGLQVSLPSASLETSPSGSDFVLVSDLENTLQDAAPGDTALQVVHLGTGLVNVERSAKKIMKSKPDNFG